MTRPGRPLGEIAQRALELAAAQPVHVYDVQSALQISRRVAAATLYNLRVSGSVVEFDRVLHPRARKPILRVTAASSAVIADPFAAWPPARRAPLR